MVECLGAFTVRKWAFISRIGASLPGADVEGFDPLLALLALASFAFCIRMTTNLFCVYSAKIMLR